MLDPVSEVLGIRISGPLPLMAAVEEGLPLTALDRVVRSVAPTDSGFACRIVPRATLARRRKSFATARDRADGRLSAEEGARLARLASVWAMALDVWGDEAAARRFMFEPHPLLHDRPPMDVVLENELGRPVVEGILGRLKYGSAV
ncbi:MAG: antitoxin Xre/MbcA/ParS toxin-binding domain-containing protein [Rhodopila sp.]|jgi:putative toxin-antitoxin system antitoxin component (TIGR02293 family)